MTHATSQIPILESSIRETYDWVDRMALELDEEDRHFALQALRAGLHALRDHLTVEQSAHLSAQFPTFIRGLYFEQWTPGVPDPIRNLDDFLARVAYGLRGYQDRCTPERAARAVFAVLEESLAGSGEKIRQTLPKPIRDLWD
jgi:uncharacterized protein (DUF2267 family)